MQQAELSLAGHGPPASAAPLLRQGEFISSLIKTGRRIRPVGIKGPRVSLPQ